MDRIVQMGSLLACKFFMNVLNTTRLHNKHYLERALFHRPPGQPLITFSNHTSVLDDPLILSTMTPLSFIKDSRMRYLLGAEEVCLGGTAWHRWLFTKAGQVIPIRRGEGPFQPAMSTALHLLSTQAIWLHIFPQGQVCNLSSNIPIRHGIARLVLECKPRPLLLPFVHVGMEGVKPVGAFMPRILKNIDVYFGEPVDSGVLVNRIPPAPDAAIYFSLTKHLQSLLCDIKTTKNTS